MDNQPPIYHQTNPMNNTSNPHENIVQPTPYGNNFNTPYPGVVSQQQGMIYTNVPSQQYIAPIPILQVPMHLESEVVYNQIKERLYHTRSCEWVGEAWRLFHLHYSFHVLWCFILMILFFTPYAGSFLAIFYFAGIQMTLINIVKNDGMVPYPKAVDGWNGFKIFCPLLGLVLIEMLLIFVGLCALVFPGIYLMIATSFAFIIFIEYHNTGLSQVDSIKLSILLINKNFCNILGFLILLYLIELLGAICLIVGLLVAFPVMSLAMTCAFRDIVGFNEKNNVNIIEGEGINNLMNVNNNVNIIV